MVMPSSMPTVYFLVLPHVFNHTPIRNDITVINETSDQWSFALLRTFGLESCNEGSEYLLRPPQFRSYYSWEWGFKVAPGSTRFVHFRPWW